MYLIYDIILMQGTAAQINHDLSTQYGLVGPSDTSAGHTPDHVLVWEDPIHHIGRFRVHFYPWEMLGKFPNPSTRREKFVAQYGGVDLIRFSYWSTDRRYLAPDALEIFRADPMAHIREEIQRKYASSILEGYPSLHERSIDSIAKHIETIKAESDRSI